MICDLREIRENDARRGTDSIHTFLKVLFPALRLAYMVVPEVLLSELTRRFGNLFRIFSSDAYAAPVGACHIAMRYTLLNMYSKASLDLEEWLQPDPSWPHSPIGEPPATRAANRRSADAASTPWKRHRDPTASARSSVQPGLCGIISPSRSRVDSTHGTSPSFRNRCGVTVTFGPMIGFDSCRKSRR
jgi:hypothetical protein